jgi:serine/threonine protein kinase
MASSRGEFKKQVLRRCGARSVAEPAFVAYEVVSTIGAGGMAEVFRARDTKLHRAAALSDIIARLQVRDDCRCQRTLSESDFAARFTYVPLNPARHVLPPSADCSKS